MSADDAKPMQQLNVGSIDADTVEGAKIYTAVVNKREEQQMLSADFVGNIAPRWFLALAAIVMLVSATFDTSATKYMNRQKLPACDDCSPTFFQAPFLQTWSGYVGELLFLPIFLLDAHFAKKNKRSRRFDFITNVNELGKPHCPKWIWIFPLILDFISTACLNYATVLVYVVFLVPQYHKYHSQASTVQMLRSFNIILTFVLSAFLLENRIYVHQLIGVALVLMGMVLVGIYAVLYPDMETNYGNLQWLGIITALIGTGMSALQWVLEETIFRSYSCSPFEAVGWMGAYGVVLGGVVLVLGELTGFEDVRGTFYQMSLKEKGSTILIVLSLAINTAAGITLTKLASSLLRTIVNAGRTVCIWVLEMILGWSTFEFLNFGGLIIIIGAMIVYNYNYLTSRRHHWFGDEPLRKPASCLPNKVEVTHHAPLLTTKETMSCSSEQSVLGEHEQTTPAPRRRKGGPSSSTETRGTSDEDVTTAGDSDPKDIVKRNNIIELSQLETQTTKSNDGKIKEKESASVDNKGSKRPVKALSIEKLRSTIPHVTNSLRRRRLAACLRSSVRKEQSKKRRSRKAAEARGEPVVRKTPVTIEHKRIKDETIVEDNDEEIAEADEVDEFASYFTGDKTPKILLTTSKNASKKLRSFILELTLIMPNIFYYKRAHYRLKSIVQYATSREYTDVVVLTERLKKPNGMYICHLPEGPTSFFKLSSVLLAQDIKGGAAATTHDPEIILNNFSTRLGRRVARQLVALFPQKPEFHGRRAICFHNQRDFIFFRHHRYIFNSNGEKCRLQEIGPRFTLKLQWMQQGTFDPTSGLLEYEWAPDTQVDRKKMFM